MRWFTRFQEVAFGGRDLGRIVRLAGSALAAQAVLVTSTYGQQAGDGTSAGQGGAMNAPAASGFIVSPGVCASAGVGGLRSIQGCVTPDGYHPARTLFNRSTPEGGWAAYGFRDSQGNPTVCTGPSEGIQLGVFGASVAPSACVTYRRDGAPAMTGDPGAAVAPDSPDSTGAAYQQMYNQVRNSPYIYNNPYSPAASNGGAPNTSFTDGANAPPSTNAPAPTSTGMTPDQFRTSVDQSMQMFRQADPQSQQGLSPQTSSPLNPTPSAGPQTGPRVMFDDNAQPRGNRLADDATGARRSALVTSAVPQDSRQYPSRTQYDAQGYRQDSPRNQYDAQGYRQNSPRNQYDAQGYRQNSPRNQYDAQGYRQDSPRNQYDAQGYRQDSPRNQYDAQGYRQDSPRNQADAQYQQGLSPLPVSSPIPTFSAAAPTGGRIGFDDNAPRNSGYNSTPAYQQQPAASPVVPAVAPRTYGTASPTAALRFPR